MSILSNILSSSKGTPSNEGDEIESIKKESRPPITSSSPAVRDSGNVFVERLLRSKEKLPLSINPNKARPSFLGSIVRAPARLAGQISQNIRGIGKAAQGKSEEEINKELTTYDPYLGEIKPIGTEGSAGKRLKESIGAGLELGSYATGSGAAGSAVKQGFKGILKRIFSKEAMKRFAIEGGVTGGTGSGGETLKEGGSAKEVLINTAAGTVLGAGAGSILGPLLSFGGYGGKVGSKEASRIVTEAKLLPQEGGFIKLPAFLEQEAKKYENVDEFIKAQGTPVYHGSKTNRKDFTNFDVGKIGSGTGTDNQGIFFTQSKDLAGRYTFDPKTGSSGTIVESYIKSSNPLIVEAKGRPLNYFNENKDKLFAQVKKGGYDSIKIQNNLGEDIVVVLKPDQIKTKSQLTDIYNKATNTEPVKTSIISKSEKVNQAYERAKAGETFGDRVIKEDTPPASKILDTAETKAKPLGLSKEKKIETLHKQLQRNADSLRAAEQNPAGHAKAYGPEAPAKYKANIERIQKELNELLPVKKPTLREGPIKVSAPNKDIPFELQDRKARIEMRAEFLDDDPYAQLLKYIPKRGDFAGQLPEVTGKGPYLFSRKGDEIIQEVFGRGDSYATAPDSEVIREGMQNFLKRRAELAEDRKLYAQSLKKWRADRRAEILNEKDAAALEKISNRAGNLSEIKVARRQAAEDRNTRKLAFIRQVEQKLRQEGRSRAQKVKLIQDSFNLTDKEIKTVMRGTPNYNVMPESDFQNLLKELQGKFFAANEKSKARVSLEGVIQEKELKKIDNLREALKMKKIENMSVDELKSFEKLLEPFQHGDEFLGRRQLETVKNTDLSGIKTKREALEILSKKTGVPIEELKQIAVTEGDRYLYDGALARRNPFFRQMVEDVSRAEIEGNIRFYDFRETMNDLVLKARRSRKQSLVDKAIPTDKRIFEYLEATAEDKLLVIKDMTPAELEAAHYIQEAYARARDYLVENETLKRFRMNYITHVRRSFLEAWREGTKESGKLGGIRAAFKEIIDSFKQDEAYFNILDQDTADILPLEKFFKYSLSRKGELVPTKNVAKAVGNYFRTFEKKRMLDSVIPKIDIYAHALSPVKTTQRGLPYDNSLKRFVKEWLNTKKGRSSRAIVKQGGKADVFLRSGVTLSRVLDLGLNVPVGIASHIGEQVMTYSVLGGKKYALGLTRFNSKQGKKISQKYVALIGETLADQLKDASKNLTEKANTIFYSLFSSASRKANIVHVLGSLTPDEFRSGTISPDHLAQIRNEMNRWRTIEGDTSILGATAEGKVFTQYKSWAVPIFHSTVSNLKKLGSLIAKKENPLKDQGVQELLRATITTAALALSTFGIYNELKDKRNRTFLENVAFKSMNDGLSLIGAVDPSFWQTARLADFVKDLTTSITNVTKSLVTGERTSKGEITGLRQLRNTVTPAAIKQLIPKEANDPLHQMVANKNAAAAAFSDEAEAKWEELKKIGEKSKEDAATAFDELFKDNPTLAKKVLAISADERLGLTPEDRLIKQLGVDNGERARYLYSEIQKLDTKEEKADYFDSIIEKKIASQEVLNQVVEMINGDTPVFKPDEKVSEAGILNTVLTYAEAIGTDPVVAFNRIFTGQKIRRVDSGAVIVERMTLAESQAVKNERGQTKGMKLDHTIPLQLGGSNSLKNLKLVPDDVWKSYTPVENYIGRKIRDGKIKKKEAQDLILRFKNGELTAEEVMSSI